MSLKLLFWTLIKIKGKWKVDAIQKMGAARCYFSDCVHCYSDNGDDVCIKKISFKILLNHRLCNITISH